MKIQYNHAQRLALLLGACLACASAQAQSSVTLYGVLDVGLGKAKGGDFGLNNGRGSTASNASYHTPSRFGFRGTEDLGQGLQAQFNLESNSMVMGSGEIPGAFFGRESWVGLSSKAWGSVRAGNTSSVAFQGHIKHDLNGLSASSAMDQAGISPLTWYGTRRAAQLQYVTPKVAGFEVGLGYVPAGNNAGQASTQVRLDFGQGPLAVTYAAETKRAAANRTAQALAGSFAVDPSLKVSVGWSRSVTTARGEGWHMGASKSFGQFTLGAQHARNTKTDVNATELFARYDLSKRTALYLDVMDKTNGGSYQFGVVHRF
jgi:predicted porin